MKMNIYENILKKKKEFDIVQFVIIQLYYFKSNNYFCLTKIPNENNKNAFSSIESYFYYIYINWIKDISKYRSCVII